MNYTNENRSSGKRKRNPVRIELPIKIILLVAFACCARSPFSFVDAAVAQDEENIYLANFDKIIEASYSQVDDDSTVNIHKPPDELLNQCKNSGNLPTPTTEITVARSGTVSASTVQSECGTDSICILPEGLNLRMDGNLNVGALIVRGSLEWTTDTQQSSTDQFLCGGYVVVEDNGSFFMELNDETTRKGWIYIKNNGAFHPEMFSRAFGTTKERDSSDEPIMIVRGRQLARTWSLLSEPLAPGSTTMKLLHDPTQMGWKVGDRLGISPTDDLARGWGQDVFIGGIRNDGTLELMVSINHFHRADFATSKSNTNAALLSAEVVNLSRSIILTGDDFEEIPCVADLPEAVAGEETSMVGCRCSSFRSKCHVGLHSMQKHGGIMKLEDIRVEKCGQRGIEGKYCLHFHKVGECPECLFKNNAIENSQQRGIIVHDTHHSQVEGNVLYNVRGANLYLEDGNEMWNTLSYNVAICPFPFLDGIYHGCTIPGTSNLMADTSDNQSGIFSRAGTNNFIGNRASNHFNGMFLKEGETGRGESNGKVCESASQLGRMEGNTWHGNGRFGTYTLGNNYPKVTDQSPANKGYNTDMSLCDPFDSNGETRGLPGAFVNHVDYGNAFVGHYSAGDMQHFGHYSTENNELMYWKETKTFENGCGAHILNGHYSKGRIALPDQATFIIENTVMGEGTTLEANHHCNVGTTGVLCMPTYVLHNVQWKNRETDTKWVVFQDESVQPHNYNQNHGGIFTLSPENAATVKAGGILEDSFFPQGYISLVSRKFAYLLRLTNNRKNLCIDSRYYYGDRYDNGILCKTELRALKIYTRGLSSGSNPPFLMVLWISDDSRFVYSQPVYFHQISNDSNPASKKQGYSVPVVPGFGRYEIFLGADDKTLPDDWVIEFSDPVIGNRWTPDELNLHVHGRSCNSVTTSQHDRKFIWGGNGYLGDEAWFHHGACVGSNNQPPDEPIIDCNAQGRSISDDEEASLAGIIPATECPSDCGSCDSTNSYCDCGSKTCKCKAGFVGPSCEIDVCADADCGEHGACAARYLGGDLFVTDTNTKCICEDGWSGDKCDNKNPCLELGMECSGNGTCMNLSDTQATCECQDGYFGPHCNERSPCESICETGTFPYFGCSSHEPGKVALGCYRTGGCHYLAEGEDYPKDDGFCTYKSYKTNTVFSTEARPTSPPPMVDQLLPRQMRVLLNLHRPPRVPPVLDQLLPRQMRLLLDLHLPPRAPPMLDQLEDLHLPPRVPPVLDQVLPR